MNRQCDETAPEVVVFGRSSSILKQAHLTKEEFLDL